MTAAQIQALIEAQPKNLNGHTLTFQFADGQYDLNAAIDFAYFYSGNLQVLGNTSETDASSLHTSQQVFLNFTTSGIFDPFKFACNSCSVYISNLKIYAPTSGSTVTATAFSENSGYTDLRYCYIYSNSTTYGWGAYANNTGITYMRNNYFSNMQRAIQNSNCFVHSYYNDDTGTAPAYGLYASGGTITKNGTQPSGSTANEATSYGGEIR
jgi:hypothetical protein